MSHVLDKYIHTYKDNLFMNEKAGTVMDVNKQIELGT